MTGRILAGIALIAAVLLGGCGKDADQKKVVADAKAKAAGFTPPAVMSRIDFGTSMDRRFRALDRNADDRITPDEFPRRNGRLKQLDADGDGAISAIEFSEGTLKRFDARDLNHDGTVTSEEHEAWRSANRADAPPVDEDTIGDALKNSSANPE